MYEIKMFLTESFHLGLPLISSIAQSQSPFFSILSIPILCIQILYILVHEFCCRTFQMSLNENFCILYLFDYSLEAHFDVFLHSSSIQESLLLHKISLSHLGRDVLSCRACKPQLSRQNLLQNCLIACTIHSTHTARMWSPM